MISSLFITILLIIAGGFVLMQLIDITESDILQMIFITIFGFMSIYLMIRFFFDYMAAVI